MSAIIPNRVDEQLTSVPRVGICDERAQVVDGRGQVFALGQCLTARPALFAVMEQLGGEELGDLVGDGVGRVIWGQRRRF